jgi:DNA-binding NarL/FixJ family response regulator
MRQVRIAVAAMPEEVHRLVRQALASDPDLSAVAVASGEVALLLEAARADVVVVGMQHGELPAVAERLLDEYPHVGVVCVDVGARRGAVYRLRPDFAAMDDVSPGALAAAIRSAAEETAAWGNR